ncbi:polysaccharide deacetylase family protein [Neobacillus novalis]|uniref:Polysaccharide deacetylase family protein n=1 Tax=Neobacillus novalis TaxID=220687 RepID=A0AA95SAS7_9BACI|nr:polysaccharide deacetylase family protein [Neobacillus novalis]WHY84208.1 polysaccharide deacetylase family protein [Neobacillus novalis]
MNRFLMLFLFLLLVGHSEKALAMQKVPILIYHSIADYSGHGSKELYVTPENFEKQMIYLRDQGYTLLTFERWQDINKVNNPIFITFDDGYKNNLNAFAIFQKLKTDRFKPTGTIFVISDFIGKSNRLTDTDLKMMADSRLISIQSHTATHPDLTKVENLTFELKVSKEKIEKITGKPVIALSYPYGNTDEQVVAETKKYYLFGLTTTPGPYSQTGIKNELYLLPRTYIKYSTTIEEFAKATQVE